MVKASEIPDVLATMAGFEEILHVDDVGATIQINNRKIRCWFGGIKGFTIVNGSITYCTNENTQPGYPYQLTLGIL